MLRELERQNLETERYRELVVQIDSGRDELYKKVGIAEDWRPFYEIVFRALDENLQTDTGRDLGISYPWASSAEWLRLTAQNMHWEGADGWQSWGDLHERYLTEVVVPNTLIDRSGVIVSIGVNPLGRGLDNLASLFPEAKIVGVEISDKKNLAAAASLRNKGHEVKEIEVDESGREGLMNLADRLKAEFDSGKIFIITAEATRVLNQLTGQVDAIVTDKLWQHLDRQPLYWNEAEMGSYPTPDVVGSTIKRSLKPAGEAWVLDLISGDPDHGWVVHAREGHEDDPAVKIHDDYIGDGRNEGAYPFGFFGRGASIFRSSEDLKDFVAKHSGMVLDIDSGREHRSGMTTDLNHPCALITACMPPTIKNGVGRARLRYELAAVGSSGEEQVRLRTMVSRLAHAESWLADWGRKYIEEVIFSPFVDVEMPMLACCMFRKP